MSVKVRIEFEFQVEPVEFVTQICGKALQHPRCKINITAQSLGVQPLCSFFVGNGARWIDRETGLDTLRTVLAYLRSGQAHVCNSERSAQDLARLEQLISMSSGGFRLNIVE